MAALAIRLRPALASDAPAVVAAMHDAFRDSLFHQRCFPVSDPASRESLVQWVDKNLADPESHMIIAERDTAPPRPLPSASSAGTGADAEPPRPVAGFARWVRRPAPSPAPVLDPSSQPPPPPPRMVFTPDMYPAGGDAALAARVFQANYDALMRATEGRIVAKLGAEALLCLAVPERGLGVAIADESGSKRGLGPAAIAVFEQLGLADADVLAPLREHHAGAVTNFKGAPVGEIRPALELRFA